MNSEADCMRLVSTLSQRSRCGDLLGDHGCLYTITSSSFTMALSFLVTAYELLPTEGTLVGIACK